MDEPERFLDSTWVLSPIPEIRMNSLLFAPAAFLRHGAIPDPEISTGEEENTMSGSLDRQRILKLFDKLSEELRFSRTRAQIYIVGGGRDELGVQPGANDEEC